MMEYARMMDANEMIKVEKAEDTIKAVAIPWHDNNWLFASFF